MTKKTLYAILGVAENAGLDDIQRAYESRLGSLGPEDSMLETAIKEAWSILSNPARRKRYDDSLNQTRMQDQALAYEEVPAGGFFGKFLLLLGLIALVGGGWYFYRKSTHPAPTQGPGPMLVDQKIIGPGLTIPTGTPTKTTAPSTSTLTPEELFNRASNSIARINVYTAGGQQLSLGSGVVIDNATVITNCHVTHGGAVFKVKMQTAQYDASILVADEKHDLCKLSVPGLSAPSVGIGRVGSLKVGQKVYAIGSPHGLDLTISDGLVSSLRDGPDGTYIQTTAPVSPGSSGGGLFDETGQLVGIVTFQDRTGQNLNFAIPAEWINTMSASTDSGNSRYATRPSGDGGSTQSDATLEGDWHCYGPLTGRGLELTFASNGVVSGSLDGKPFMGRYYMQGKQLVLMSEIFQVEELSATRLVMNQGSGQRLVCNR